jgi:GMP synthase-like glutamine amidotransferase
MKILIISTCKDKLSELEFVRPIERLVGDCTVKRYDDVKPNDVATADKIIITGTALKDFDYLSADWGWLKTTDKPVLGICAGMQVIAQAHGVPLQDVVAIGPQKVIVERENKLAKGEFESYFLHTKTGTGSFLTLATSNGKPCIIKHPEKELYGCIFHPEVMNEGIIRNFLS